VHLGRYEAARTRAHTAIEQSRASGLPTAEGDAHHLLAAVALAEEAYQEVWQLQQIDHPLMNVPHLGPLSLGGYATRGLGRADLSGQLLWQEFRQAADTRSVPRLLTALPGVALALADRGEIEQAVEVYALAMRYAMIASSRWFEEIAGKHIAAAAEALPLDAAAAARERGQARDLWATVQELLQ
jgi:hypothetical protein